MASFEKNFCHNQLTGWPSYSAKGYNFLHTLFYFLRLQGAIKIHYYYYYYYYFSTVKNTNHRDNVIWYICTKNLSRYSYDKDFLICIPVHRLLRRLWYRVRPKKVSNVRRGKMTSLSSFEFFPQVQRRISIWGHVGETIKFRRVSATQPRC